jgi:hypothetical protein
MMFIWTSEEIPLWDAVRADDLERAESLIHLVDLSQMVYSDFDCRSRAMAELLVKHGLDVNAKDDDGHEALIDRMTNIRDPPYEVYTELICYLIEMTKDPSSQRWNYDSSGVMHHVQTPRELDMLLARGVDIDQTNKYGHNLLCAIRVAPLETIVHAMKRGISIQNESNVKYRGPLFDAIIRACERVPVLLRAGSKPHDLGFYLERVDKAPDDQAYMCRMVAYSGIMTVLCVWSSMDWKHLHGFRVPVDIWRKLRSYFY